MDGGRNLRQLRKDLGEDAILGAYCNTSRHDGLTAGEAGADYVSFGPVAASALGDGAQVDPELLIRSLSDKVDFFAIGAEIWTQDDPLAQLHMLAAARNS